MAETLVYEDDERRVYEDSGDGWTSIRTEWKPGTVQHARETRDTNLAQAISTLRQWAVDAEATTATQGNAVAVLNVVVDRLGVFFDHFADLLEQRYGE